MLSSRRRLLSALSFCLQFGLLLARALTTSPQSDRVANSSLDEFDSFESKIFSLGTSSFSDGGIQNSSLVQPNSSRFNTTSVKLSSVPDNRRTRFQFSFPPYSFRGEYDPSQRRHPLFDPDSRMQTLLRTYRDELHELPTATRVQYIFYHGPVRFSINVLAQGRRWNYDMLIIASAGITEGLGPIRVNTLQASVEVIPEGTTTFGLTTLEIANVDINVIRPLADKTAGHSLILYIFGDRLDSRKCTRAISLFWQEISAAGLAEQNVPVDTLWTSKRAGVRLRWIVLGEMNEPITHAHVYSVLTGLLSYFILVARQGWHGLSALEVKGSAGLFVSFAQAESVSSDTSATPSTDNLGDGFNGTLSDNFTETGAFEALSRGTSLPKSIKTDALVATASATESSRPLVSTVATDVVPDF